jgi:hypothetical protein
MKLVRKLYERNIEAGTVQQLRQDFKKIWTTSKTMSLC